MIVPCNTPKIYIDRVFGRQFFYKDFSSVFEDLGILDEQFKLSHVYISEEWNKDIRTNLNERFFEDNTIKKGVQKKWGILEEAVIDEEAKIDGILASLNVFSWARWSTDTDDQKLLPTQVINLDPKIYACKMTPTVEVTPSEIVPKATTELFVSGPNISSETEVRIHNIAIPKKHTRLVGRNKLKILLAPNSELKDLLETHIKKYQFLKNWFPSVPALGPTVKLTYFTPGMPNPYSSPTLS